MIINKLNVLLNSTQVNQIDYTITRYIKIHIREMKSITIAELAENCFVSQAMISKYCRRLGYENFKHLKDECREYIRMVETNFEPFRFEAVSLKECSSRYVQELAEMQMHILEKMDFVKLDKLADCILHSHCLFLYGADYNQVLCRHVQYRLDIYGVTVVVIDEAMVKSYVIKPNSMILLFNDSEMKRKVQLLSQLVRKDRKTWFITGEVIQGKEEVSILIEGVDNGYAYKFIADLLMNRIAQKQRQEKFTKCE